MASHPPQDALQIHGSEGTLTYNFITDEIHLGRWAGAREAVPIPTEEVKEWTVERDFIERRARPSAPRPKPDFTKGIKYMRVSSEAAAESMGCREYSCA